MDVAECVKATRKIRGSYRLNAFGMAGNTGNRDRETKRMNTC